MQHTEAITLVSRALKHTLLNNLQPPHATEVTLRRPDDDNTRRRLNLFLYAITPPPLAATEGHAPAQPLPLNLRYMLTAYAPDGSHDPLLNAYDLLAQAMDVLHTTPVLLEPPPFTLPQNTSAPPLRVRLHSPDFDTLARLWATFGVPYQLSVVYEVSGVVLGAPAAGPLPARHGADGRAAAGSPRLAGMEPSRVRAGDTLWFRGASLAGHAVTVQLADALHTTLTPDDDSFVIGLPLDLAPGFYQVVVDVAEHQRRAFDLNVIPSDWGG